MQSCVSAQIKIDEISYSKTWPRTKHYTIVKKCEKVIQLAALHWKHILIHNESFVLDSPPSNHQTWFWKVNIRYLLICGLWKPRTHKTVCWIDAALHYFLSALPKSPTLPLTRWWKRKFVEYYLHRKKKWMSIEKNRFTANLQRCLKSEWCACGSYLEVFCLLTGSFFKALFNDVVKGTSVDYPTT